MKSGLLPSIRPNAPRPIASGIGRERRGRPSDRGSHGETTTQIVPDEDPDEQAAEQEQRRAFPSSVMSPIRLPFSVRRPR